MTTPVLHVDMDSFFASVAIRDRPELWDVPVVVGGGERGVVVSANYPARAHGIRAGMPGSRARRLCPQVQSVRLEPGAVSAASSAVMDIFRRVTPRVQVMSVDEAFLDVSGAVRLFGPPEVIAERLRAQVRDEQRLGCSVGVAASVSVAKLASRRAKPDGVVVVPPGQVVAFLHPLDVGELWGVGDKTAQRLRHLGVHTVGDLAHHPADLLAAGVGARAAAHLRSLAWGTDTAVVAPTRGATGPERSMGAQETFGRDVDDRAHVDRELLRLAHRVARRVRAARLVGRTVALTVRWSDFTTVTRSRTLPEPTSGTHDLHSVALELFDTLVATSPRRLTRVRLVGVRLEGLRPAHEVHRQLVMGERDPGWRAAEGAADQATERFGSAAVRPASLLPPPTRGGDRAIPGSA